MVKATDMKRGTKVVSIDHPEWGEWEVLEETEHDGAVWWDIRSDRGTRVLHAGELKFWRLA